MNLSNWFAGCQSLEGVNQANCVNGRFLGSVTAGYYVQLNAGCKLFTG